MRFVRGLVDFIDDTEPAGFLFSDQDLDMLGERMLENGKGSRHRTSSLSTGERPK